MNTLTAEQEKVMKRIQKLLNLGDSAKNSNEHEVQAALLKAQMMMAENNIQLSDLDALETPKKKKEVVERGSEWAKQQWYNKALASLIAKNFRCYYFFRTSNGMSKIVFMGLKADADLASTMYEFAVLALEYNSDEYIKEQRQIRYIRDSRGIKTTYMKGFINGLYEKFAEQAKQKVTQNVVDEAGVASQVVTSMSLVLVKDDALVEAHKAMKFTKAAAPKGGRNGVQDADAYASGKQKGKSFEAASGFIK